jgi:hypothetical protein
LVSDEAHIHLTDACAIAEFEAECEERLSNHLFDSAFWNAGHSN